MSTDDLDVSTPLDGLALHHVDAGGARIAYRRGGPTGGPPFVLVHGRAGHMGWWFGVGPTLAERHDLVVVDLSGHGDSDHRSAYSPTTWATDLQAVIDDLDAAPAVVIGHSMGGHIAAHLASIAPDRVRALVLVDSRLDSEPYRAPAHDVVRIYPTREDGLANFRLRPRGTTAAPELLREVARYGLGATEAGWRWKFDPGSGQPFTAADIEGAVRGISCPVGVVYGELSELASDASADYLSRQVGRTVPRIGIADAYHHVPLDEPDACVAALESITTTLLEPTTA